MTGKKFLKTLPPLGVVAPPGVCRQLGDGDVGGNLAHRPSQLLQRRLRTCGAPSAPALPSLGIIRAIWVPLMSVCSDSRGLGTCGN